MNDDEKWPMGSQPGIIPDREAEWWKLAEDYLLHKPMMAWPLGTTLATVLVDFQRWLAERDAQ